MLTRALVAVTLVALASPALAQPDAKARPDYTRTRNEIYGRKDGVALTMDVFAPNGKANGRGVIVCVSAEFRSTPEFLEVVATLAVKPLVDRGYTVFAVMHGSQPRYTVPEIVDDLHRAVRFVKANAKKYGVDAEKLGIVGASSGGHLALMMGCAGKPGNPAAADPVEKESSQVAAVACFFPVTDFLEFDRPDLPKNQEAFRPLFDVREFDPKTNRLERVTPEKRTEYGRLNSPYHLATKAAAPARIVHGDKDALVPVGQSRKLIEKLEGLKVPCDLIVRKGRGHGWLGMDQDVPALVDWFDTHLLDKK